MTRNGEPIQTRPLRRTIATGIDIEDIRLDFGLVSEFEERDVSVQAGYTWKEWEATDVRDKAAHVAYFRIKRLMSMHADEAVVTDQELRARRREREMRQRKGDD